MSANSFRRRHRRLPCPFERRDVRAFAHELAHEVLYQGER